MKESELAFLQIVVPGPTLESTYNYGFDELKEAITLANRQLGVFQEWKIDFIVAPEASTSQLEYFYENKYCHMIASTTKILLTN